MFHRIINLPKTHSFFLFGARGTGKTTLLRHLCTPESTLFVDLLNLEEETGFIRDPERLGRLIDGLSPAIRVVVVDEIQRVPRLLDVIHRKLEERKRRGTPLQFIMSGSSARKLKRGAANLLAGRAFVYHLFPLTTTELQNVFDLQTALEYGTLPEVWNLKEKETVVRYLEAYSRTYLKEEIWNEQIIRKLEPFSYFLEVAAQMNGRVLNFSKIGRDIGVDTKTVQSYFQILEDTLLGYFLPSFHRSLRKRQLTNPKFYFFDTGVKRALERSLTVPLLPQTYAFGEAFEHFVFLEMQRRNEYHKRDYRFSYLQTHDGAGVDFVIERPGRPIALVEIKSATRIEPSMAKHLQRFCGDLGDCEAYLLSLDSTPQKFGLVHALPWEQGLQALGL
ncbi:MAG: AAA family ATPase [candidate division KSB1 bacterium]|nr:AAA family ATPase [candidate division KSB1 bacterium]MDZ7304865.1 AAA family ATPase [candidate division KSB1 bacterium]MDZ7314118.1 AAA family ATPase [candidate division KSB1 bacterium]